MSKFLPDPQIQSLRAMRAGDIAFALPAPATMTVGQAHVATAQPIHLQSITVSPATPAIEPTIALASQNPVVSSAFATVLTQDQVQSKSLVATESLETLSGTPSESPVVGVATGTSVI